MPHPLDPKTLAEAPELATLAVLDALLFMTTRVLAAQHRTLDDECPDARRGEPPTLREARRVLRRIAPLQDALLRYRVAVFDVLGPPRVENDVIPF